MKKLLMCSFSRPFFASIYGQLRNKEEIDNIIRKKGIVMFVKARR
jgi:hypothetical protein